MLLPIHVAAGGLALVLGAVALLAKKGGTVHRRSGLLFVYAMVVRRDVLLVVEGPRPPHVASARPERFDATPDSREVIAADYVSCRSLGRVRDFRGHRATRTWTIPSLAATAPRDIRTWQ